jgi:YaeC family lipoprotein
VPHAEILAYVDENLAAEAGIDLEIVEYTDYVQPNVALSEGDLDANYFQHLPYFDAEVAEKGYEFTASPGIHIEPYGVYSESVASLDELPDGAQVAVPNDPSNQARALVLLENEGLLTLADVENPTIFDVADNPKNIELSELDAAQLPRSLQDVDAAVINGNFALEAGLVPTEDAIALESVRTTRTRTSWPTAPRTPRPRRLPPWSSCSPPTRSAPTSRRPGPTGSSSPRSDRTHLRKRSLRTAWEARIHASQVLWRLRLRWEA